MTASGAVKSTTTSAAVSGVAVVTDVDAGDQRQIVGGLDGAADLGAHPASGAEHPDLDHRSGCVMPRRLPRRSSNGPMTASESG